MFPFFNNYPGTDLHEIDLAYILKVCSDVVDKVREQDDKIAAVEQLAEELKDFVNNYFDNLNVQREINRKIDSMVEDGSLMRLIEEPVAETAAAWLAENLTPTQPPVDSSLSISGAAADAKVTGDKITALESELTADTNAIASGTSIDYYFTWEQGSIDTTTGEDSPTAPTRYARCGLFSVGANEFTLKVGAGYRASVFCYDETGTYVFRYGWRTGEGEYTFVNGYAKYRIMAQKTESGATIDAAETTSNCYINTAPHWISYTDNKIAENKIDITDEYTYPPSEFRWQNNPLKGKIRNTFKGIVKVDFDVAEYDPTSELEGVTYYVDGVNGNDANSGLTPDLPLQKMSTAYAKNDIACMILKGGVYLAVRNLFSTTINKSIAIKGAPGENVIISTTSLTALTAVTGHAGTYSGSRGNCYGVIDLAVPNNEGDPTQYTRVDSTTEVYANEGTWYITEGTIYIHTLNGRTPDENLLLFRNGDNLSAAGDLTLYLENIKVYGGNSPLMAKATSSTDNLKVYAKDCDFYYTYTNDNDCVMLQGVKESIFQNCRVKYSKKDGFNYHIAQGIAPKAIEINCSGSHCGNADDNDDQCSSIHNAGSIIRVGCLYHDCYGSIIADNNENTESWNVGCTAYRSLAAGSQNANFYAYSGVHMWLESCVGFSSTNNAYKYDSNTILRIRNCHFDKQLAGTGHEPEYY